MKLCILFIMLLALVDARAQNSETGKSKDISIEKGADATNEEQIKLLQQQHKNVASSTSTLTNEQIVLLTLIPLGILLLVFSSVLVALFLTSQAKFTKQDDFEKIEPLTVRF